MDGCTDEWTDGWEMQYNVMFKNVDHRVRLISGAAFHKCDIEGVI